MKKRAEFVSVVLTALAIMATLVLGSAAARLVGPPCDAGSICRLFKLAPVGGQLSGESSFAESPSGGSRPPQEWKAVDVRVAEENGKWFIRGTRTTVELDPSDLRLTAVAGGRAWRFLPSASGDLTAAIADPVAEGGADAARPKKKDVLSLRLADAAKKSIEPYKTGYLSGLKIELSGYSGPPAQGNLPARPAPLDLTIHVFLGLEGPEEELLFRIIATDGATRVRELAFPASPAADSFDHTVVPFMQGMLLPKAWPKKVTLYDPLSYGRGLYMPWWGHQQGDGALLVLLETPADAGVRFEHPAGGPTRAAVRWLHSLGRWSYPRRVRYVFLDKGGYVGLAKRYRSYAIATGNFVSLKEKIARNPLVAKLVGSPVIHTSILYHIQPDSSYYKKDDPAANHQLVTFDERAAQLRRLAARGVKRAYIHLDGWGARGYDNLHPDVLPPNDEAGGWAGLKRFAEACEELGYVFAVHDQYRDYYMDAPSYDPGQTIIELDGSRPSHAIWYGGKQSILCSSLAPGYVRRNFGELLRQGVRVRGAYLDVFAVVPGDECYSPEHPVTRAESLAYRGQCLDFIRSFGGVVSSEEPADWAIPHLDLVHHGPHALDPNPGQGPAVGIAIPLFSLVYHDALFLPWSLSKGAWGIPESDLGFYYALGHAGLPYLSVEPTDEELARVRAVCELNERLALVELVGHEFVGGNVRLQRFSYADGTRVTFNLDEEPQKAVRIER
jgi:Family of unknown function (DUF5696)